MLVQIANSPRAYSWGSRTAISDLLGTLPSGGPEAELWLGAHPASPSVILDPSMTGGATDLAAWIAADPATTLGRYAPGGRLPFLLKVLAAAAPLSLQAHPDARQARDGFARENAAGIPLDSPDRNYKDAFPKPELIYALSPTFDALCGFRSLEETRQIFGALLAADGRESLRLLLASLDSGDAPRSTFEWLLGGAGGVQQLVGDVVALAASARGWELEFQTVQALAEDYPGDPGIVISLLLNRVQLRAGEALYLPAGNIHAYLQGLGVELMAASDNVLRGGLTPKHIDVPELVSLLDFHTASPPYLRPTSPAAHLDVFHPPDQNFQLTTVSGEARCSLEGPAIVLCTSGGFTVNGTRIDRGNSYFVTPDERELAVTGGGELFIATTG